MTQIIDSKGVVSEQELTNLENQLGIKLPIGYREFLKKHNGGYPQPDGFDFADDGSSVDRLFEVSDSKNESITAYFNTYKNRIPKNYFPVAKDPGGNLILIEINGAGSEIYYWDHENEVEDGDVPGMDNMYLIAYNFDEFINNLYEIEI
ncbi:SMI1/KNR4 family protein [Rosenbergiella epipactidis]|uniref:SMI1/KNR4 family protein n=1 Tax=Rosenbergiella epipactidis TaxID=1544694 RepID=UPI001F4F99A5|nr:SMI1/KNR4 family protein [Rosenbergiella epipactidis]